jgi:hypothetical protein
MFTSSLLLIFICAVPIAAVIARASTPRSRRALAVQLVRPRSDNAPQQVRLGRALSNQYQDVLHCRTDRAADD